MAKLDLLEKKSIIGMIHTLALPGTMDYCGDMTKVIDRALADLHAMQNAGVDAVIVENFCDHPAGTKLEPEQMAALTAVATVVAREATIPVGIDAAFCDPMASLAIAVAVGATFIRVPVFVDTVVTSDGIVKPCARELQRYRKLLGAENIALLCDIQTKHTFMLSSAISIEESALMATECGADALIITGAHTGSASPLETIRLLKDNHLDDAGRMLFENNPLTTVCSLVCNHENQCEGHCIRNRMPSHDPVHFSIIEDYISTTYANKMTSGPAPKNGMKAAVVGSGPAGLTVAVLLARWGYDVTIFDARDKIGGVMRYGIPNYRLPDSVLDDFQYRHLELKGIHVRPNTAIGKTITIDDLFRDGYKSVFIGAGLWKANAMHIKGETLGNAAFGIDYLANSKAFQLGDDIAVIGVGNSAMDCARTAIRNGARHVTCYARRDEECISASEHEVRYAKLEGVGFRFCKAPVEIRENGIICRDTVKGEDGKFTQIEGSETFYPHTGVIVSVSQGSESNLVKTTTGIETNQKGLLTVSEDGSTTREGVFAGGDAVMGARTVVEAVAVAKKVAESMDAYMKSLPAEEVADPYANIPVFQTPTSDVLAKQEI